MFSREHDSIDAVVGAIKRRVGIPKLTELIREHGLMVVADALEDTGSFYGSRKLDEIGSSDVTAFVEAFYRNLPKSA